MPTTDTWWYTKSRRAQNLDDYETWIEGGVMPTMNAFDNGDIRTTILVGCFELWDFPTESVAPAMTSRRARDLIKYEEVQAYDEFNDSISDTHHTLRAGTKQSTGVLIQSKEVELYNGVESLTPWPEMGEAMRVYGENGVAPIVKSHQNNVFNKPIVRRLTPVECERLQGFPDNWTEGQSDSARYKQMGNAVAVPVVEWIIGNICDTLKEAE